MTWKEGGLILFDGQCSLCDSAVQFVFRRDPAAYFKFASLQSSLGQQTGKVPTPETFDGYPCIDRK
jgi:predicted DCC family thiol-disulfide oxidoreductase YuxK